MESHLNREQLDELRQALLKRFDDLRERIREELLQQDNQLFVDLAGQVHDAEEGAVADLLVDLNLSSINRHVVELREVDAALLRMRTGEYGICIDTGEPIPYERLRANPAAARTIEAQELHERVQPQGRHPTL